VALLGRNGSGKTTLLRLAATALRPTRGTLRVFGEDTVAARTAVREWVGMLGHQAGVYDELTAAENLAFALRMMGRPADARSIDAVLERVSLLRERAAVARDFSAGMRRRLALARLLLRPPRLLLLDEPYASFDGEGVAIVNEFSDSIRRQGGAVVVATHDLARGGDVWDRAIRLEHGLARAHRLDSPATAATTWPTEAVG
jgi:heme exporter protein A